MVAQAFSSEDPGGAPRPAVREPRLGDGKPFDLANVTHRVHRGDESQEPDSLIEAKQGERQGAGLSRHRVCRLRAAAARGFRQPHPAILLRGDPPGRRRREEDPRGDADPRRDRVRLRSESRCARSIAPGTREAAQPPCRRCGTDWQASLDELQAALPEPRAGGAGGDLVRRRSPRRPLHAEAGRSRPRHRDDAGGVERGRTDARDCAARQPARGRRRPSAARRPTRSVIRAIRDLAERGLEVTFYPFIMMDIAGRTTGCPTPMAARSRRPIPGAARSRRRWRRAQPGSPDKTAGGGRRDRGLRRHGGAGRLRARRRHGDLFRAGRMVVPPDDPALRLSLQGGGRRRCLPHRLGAARADHAALRAPAPIPSSRARDARRRRAARARRRRPRSPTRADWSEYFGHQPADGSGDVFFHLDPLWADATSTSSASTTTCRCPTGATATTISTRRRWDYGRDAAYLRANIAGGEGFDWYYAERRRPRRAGAHRRSPTAPTASRGSSARRTSSAGGATRTYDRPGGVEAATPDRLGAGREADLVHRDRLPGGRQGAEPAQRLSRSEIVGERACRIIRAARATTSSSGASSPRRSATGTRTIPDMSPGGNPVSGVYGGRMVRPDAHPSVDLGRAALSGLSRCSPTSGRTAPTGRPATG